MTLALATAFALGQVFTVDPNGNGADFTDLQTAADSVPDRSTLVILAGFTSAVISTDKSLTIQDGIFGGRSGFLDPSVLEIYADPDDEIHLVNVNIAGTWADQQDHFSQNGLVINAGRVIIDSCVISVTGHELDANESDLPPPVAVLATSELLVIRNSTITGSTPDSIWFDSCSHGGEDVKGSPGGTAVLGGSLVIVTNSTILGGDGGNAEYSCICTSGALNDLPPSSLVGGDGGAALIGDAYVSNSNIRGGIGGLSWTSGCSNDAGEGGNDGVAVTGAEVDLFDRLAVSTPRIGDACSIDAVGFKPISLAFVLIAELPSVPSYSRKLGYWFIGAPLLLLPYATDSNGELHAAEDVPDDESIVGMSLCLQATDGGQLTEPETTVIRW